jgi:very-short-patch-repair endonuclease
MQHYNKYIRGLSPSKFIRLRYYQNLPLSETKRKRVQAAEFRILQYGEQDCLIKWNYNMSQLKMIAKHYRISSSGNKDELLCRLYNRLKLGFYARKIQKNVRRSFVSQFIKSRGEMTLKRKLCVNECDFYSLDSLDDIPIEYFCSIREVSGDHIHHYGFDLRSLSDYIKVQKQNIKNPYTSTEFTQDISQTIKKCILTAKLIGIPLDIQLNTKTLNSVEQNTQEIMASNTNEFLSGIQGVLHEIDGLGHLGTYTDIRWYEEIQRFQIRNFIIQTFDIFAFRLGLTRENQREITGSSNLSYCLNGHNINQIRQLSIDELKRTMLYMMRCFVLNGVSEDNRKTGAIIIMMGTTLISNSARDVFPALFQSVV